MENQLLKIPMVELQQRLSEYIVNNDLNDMTDKSKKIIHIDCQSMLLPLMYIITMEYGYSMGYYITGLQDANSYEDEYVDMDGTPANFLVGAEYLREIESELKEMNVYLEEPRSFILSYTNRLAVFSMKDFVSKQTLYMAFVRICESLHVGTADKGTISKIATSFVYIEDVTTYAQNSELLLRLNSWGATSFMVVSSIQGTKVEREVIRINELWDIYKGLINENNSIVLSETSEILAEVMKLNDDSFRLRNIQKLYDELVALSQEYLIIDLYEVPAALHTCLALAFMNKGKKAVFTCNVEDSIFADVVKDIYLLRDFPIGERIARMMDMFVENQLLLLNNGHSYMAVLKASDLNVEYKLVRVEDVIEFISYVDGKFISTLPAEGCSAIRAYNENDISIYEIDDADELRYGISEVSRLIFRRFGEVDLDDYEQIVYLLLRSLEQLTCNNLSVKTLGDILVLEESGEDAYIGFATMNPVCEVDSLLVGSITRIVHMSNIAMEVAPINLVYDYQTFITKLRTAYINSHLPTDIHLEVLEIPPLTEWQTTKSLYKALGAYTKSKHWYTDAKVPVEHQAELAYVDSCITNLRKNWLPYATETITSYGLRLLSNSDAPLTIYGGINFANTKGSGNRAKTIIYWEAFKHLPTYKKGGN